MRREALYISENSKTPLIQFIHTLSETPPRSKRKGECGRKQEVRYDRFFKIITKGDSQSPFEMLSHEIPVAFPRFHAMGDLRSQNAKDAKLATRVMGIARLAKLETRSLLVGLTDSDAG